MCLWSPSRLPLTDGPRAESPPSPLAVPPPRNARTVNIRPRSSWAALPSSAVGVLFARSVCSDRVLARLPNSLGARDYFRSRDGRNDAFKHAARFPLYRALLLSVPAVFSSHVSPLFSPPVRLIVSRARVFLVVVARGPVPPRRCRPRRRRRPPRRCPVARSVYSTGIARASPHAVDAQQKEDETEEGDRVLSYANIG